MSWYAHAWAESAPVADVQEFAILAVMAQYARRDGTGSFQSVATIAGIIKCDERTVRRRIEAMLRRGLIALGDQRLAAHIDRRYRPKVYDLMIPYCWYSKDQLKKVDQDRKQRGLPPLAEADRPPIPDTAEAGRKTRSDQGVPCPARRRRSGNLRPAA